MRPKSHFTSAISFLAIIIMVWYAFYSQTPSSKVKQDVPKTQWSTARALEHVQAISQEPHFVGSTAHDKVRDYIVQTLEEMGLKTELQEGTTLDRWGNMARPTNILARIKGSRSNENALLLLSHYDSDPHSSYGASDAGSGVATILEGVRAYLAQNQTPENDIIICITDAEELGLNGAELFVNQHPWAKDVSLVLNFEARGSGGPSYMLVETNGGNRKIIEEFSVAGVDYPVANSLAYSIYQMIPNDTDLTVFREDGDINGLNFAFIGDHYDYHTELDNYERLDRNTLAHQGAYLMPLLSHFSSIDMQSDLKVDKGDDLVYFPMPLVKMMTFPFSWLAALIIVAGLTLLFLIVLGVKKNRIQLKHLFGGFIPFLGSLVLGFVLPYYAWKMIAQTDFYIDQVHGFPYNGYWLIACAVFMSLSVSFYLYHKFYHRDRIASLSVAPLIVLWLICLLIAFPVGEGGLIPNVFLPGAGFFVIPLFAGLLMLWLNIYKKRPSYVILVLLAVPAIFIFSPFIKAFPVALGMKILFVAAILTALLFGLLVPIFGHYRKKGLLAGISLLITIVCVGLAFAKAEFSPQQPKPTSLVYVVDQDQEQAQWATYDRALGDWTKSKLGEDPTTAEQLNKNTIDSKYGTGFSYAVPAEYISLPKLELQKLIDTVYQDLRRVVLKVHSKSPVQRLEIFADEEFQFEDASVNGKPAYKDKNSGKAFPNRYGNRMLSYYIKDNEPLELELVFDAQTAPELQFYAASFDLFNHSELDVRRRDRDEMSMPFVLNDAVLRKRYLRLSRPEMAADSVLQNE
ncbi:M28 family peptidase [Nonlabens xiamenensis]|uniref:M28 family peptidase n=1 Tax=Nonlabens xiamenensis TaxID=2341043 RepID=UPI000F60D956|nr:M28 family peptidase [Nonlabens xiamenensis]